MSAVFVTCLWQQHSPLGVEDTVEGGSPPVLTRQREDGPQVVEGDVALGDGALQPGFLEGGPLLLQGPGTTQITLRERAYQVLSMEGMGQLNYILIF